jgi:hypothetical protein
MSENRVVQVAPKAQPKKIVVRKPGAVRLTAMCTQYGYNNCSCI